MNPSVGRSLRTVLALVCLAALARRSDAQRSPSAEVAAGGSIRELLMAVGESRSLFELSGSGAGKSSAVQGIQFESSNEAVVAVGTDGVMRAMRVGRASVTAVAPGLDGRLVTRGVDVRVLGRRGELIGSVAVGGRPFGVAVRADGLALVGRQDADSLSRIRLPRLAVAGSIGVGRDPGDIAFGPDGCRAYVTNVLGSSVSVVDVATGTELGRFRVPGSPLRVLLSPDGSRVFATSSSGILTVISSAKDSVLETFRVGGVLNGIAARSDRAIVYLSSTAGDLVELDLERRRMAVIGRGMGRLQDIALAPDGQTLYAADEGGRLHALDLSTRQSRSVRLEAGAFGLRLHPGGSLLYVTQPGAGRVLIVSRLTLQTLATVEVGGQPRRIAFAPDGSFALVPNERDRLDVVF